MGKVIQRGSHTEEGNHVTVPYGGGNCSPEFRVGLEVEVMIRGLFCVCVWRGWQERREICIPSQKLEVRT